MPQGYYTIQRWTPPKRNVEAQWRAVLHLPFGASLKAAEQAVQQLDKPGFYRIVQTQRVIWTERTAGKLRLRKSHAGSPRSLERMRKMFDRCGGVYPVEEVQAARRLTKNKKVGVSK